MDATPGRLAQVTAMLKHSGQYYGQCSEICGVNHGYMPISVIISNVPNWIKAIFNNKSN